VNAHVIRACGLLSPVRAIVCAMGPSYRTAQRPGAKGTETPYLSHLVAPERIDSDQALEDEVGLLILAALEGDTQLDEYLQMAEIAGSGLRTTRLPGAWTIRWPWLRPRTATAHRWWWGSRSRTLRRLGPSSGDRGQARAGCDWFE
jgi:hypothetical protein